MTSSAYILEIIQNLGWKKAKNDSFEGQNMGWLWLGGSLELQVTFAKEPYKRQKKSAKETYNFKEPTNRSQPIPASQAENKMLDIWLEGAHNATQNKPMSTWFSHAAYQFLGTARSPYRVPGP